MKAKRNILNEKLKMAKLTEKSLQGAFALAKDERDGFSSRILCVICCDNDQDIRLH